MKIHLMCVLLAGAAGFVLAGCSTQQLYAAGQQWQRNHCQKIEDRAERNRCEQDVATSFDRYQAQTRPPQ